MLKCSKFLAIVTLVAGSDAVRADGETCLTDLTKTIERDFSAVSSVSREDFASLRQRSDVIVFDTREEAEFSISHVPGAIHVHPNITPQDFIEKFGDRLKDKTVLFYCSVGVRSSNLVRKLDHDIRRLGGRSAANIRGGIFSWHNHGNPLSRANSSTDAVHGYSPKWGRYLDFDNLAVYPPKPSNWQRWFSRKT